MNQALLKPPVKNGAHRSGVLLPLPLAGAYDYLIAPEIELPRGTLVSAPLGPHRYVGVVWKQADGSVPETKLRQAIPLEGHLRLPCALCDFIDWVARYTFSSPGTVLALALRSPQAFEPERPRVGFIRGAATPAKITPARQRVLEIARDGLARSIQTLADEANASPAVVRGLAKSEALVQVSLPEFSPLPQPDPGVSLPAWNP